MKRLCVLPYGGLANRMRTVVSALNLANRFDARTRIVWRVTQDFGATFEELFEPIEDSLGGVKNMRIPLLVEKFGQRLMPLTQILCRFSGGKAIFNLEKIGDFEAFKRKARRWNTVWVRSCSSFYRDKSNTALEKVFVPKKEIMERARALSDEAMIGLHIRRGDNLVSKTNSPLSLFIAEIESELKADSRTRFFLSTDDEETERFLRLRYPDAIVCQIGKRNARNDRKGMEDALVDFIALSRCRKILGSYWSSFSEIASEYGQCELKILRGGGV